MGVSLSRRMWRSKWQFKPAVRIFRCQFIEFGPAQIYGRLDAKSTLRSKIVRGGGGGGPEVSL